VSDVAEAPLNQSFSTRKSPLLIIGGIAGDRDVAAEPLLCKVAGWFRPHGPERALEAE